MNCFNTGSWLFIKYLPKNYPPALIAALIALKIKILRLPGGETANTTNGPAGNPGFKNSQLVNFIELCKLIGVTEVYYVCNLFQPGKLKANLAAIDMLVKAGLKVSVELGNELYQKPEIIGIFAKASGVMDAKRIQAYKNNTYYHITEIRNRWPEMKILLPVAHWGNQDKSLGSTWNNMVMDTFSGHSGYAYHFYVNPGVSNEFTNLEYDLAKFDLPVEITESFMQLGYEGAWVNTEYYQTLTMYEILNKLETVSAKNTVFINCLLGFQNFNYYPKLTCIDGKVTVNY